MGGAVRPAGSRSSGNDCDALVVGAGAAGLAAALELTRAGLDVRVLEAQQRPGGVLWSERTQGFLVERGPNTVLVKAPALAFLKAHGLVEAMQAAQPASRLRFLFHAGRLEAVPMSPWAFLRTPLLSPRGKLRLLAEPFVRRGDASAESVAGFVTRRLGPEALERLVAPFLTGIYAGDEERLGAQAVFGVLVELEREHGSIVRGLLARGLRGGRRERGLPGTWSAREGLGGLAARMASSLGAALELGTRVVALRREGERFALDVEEPGGARTLRSGRLVLATAAAEAATLLRPLDAEAAALLQGIDSVPVISLSVAVDPRETRAPIEGFGFLVPRAAGLDLLGCLFMSRLFPGRAPADSELLTCMLGGERGRALLECSDEELLGRVQGDLERTLGLRAAARPLALTRWPRAVPQPGPDHGRRVAAVRARLARLSGLALAGAHLDGVSVADTLACGARAAAQVAGALRG